MSLPPNPLVAAAAAGRDLAAPSEAWRSRLIPGPKGDLLLACQHNTLLILEHHPAWEGVLGLNEFSGELLKLKPPPTECGEAGVWTDVDSTRTLAWLAEHERMITGVDGVDRAVYALGYKNRFSPPRDWLQSLPAWDGVPRLGSLMADAWGARQDDYTAYVGTALMVMLVARIMEPGCKCDLMVVLEGEQGIGKTRSFEVLVGIEPGWCMEVTLSPQDREFAYSLRGSWVAAFGELSAFGKAEVARVKQVITTREDKYRVPWGRHFQTHPRQCIFVGSVNDSSYLPDHTGNRRFLPVYCSEVNINYLRQQREQLFAEALSLWKPKGEEGGCWPYWRPPESARDEQEARRIMDAWEPVIDRWLDQRVTGVPTPDIVTDSAGLVMAVEVSAVMREALSIETGRQDNLSVQRVKKCLSVLGWREKRPGRQGPRRRVWARPGGVP